MNPRTWIASIALFCAGCGGVEPSATAPDVTEPTGALAALHDVADHLDRVAGRAAGSAELEGLPGWAVLGPWGTPSLEPAPLDRLREIARGDHPPRIRALALLWLATAGSLDDLELIDALLDARDPAGSFPTVRVTQHVQPSYPVTWEEPILGRVALEAAGIVVGRRFDDTADYRRWRAEQGDLASSVAYWEGRFQSLVSPEARAEQVAAIRERDPELLVRLLLLADESQRRLYGIDDRELEALTAGLFDADRLVRLLNRQERWPEFADPARFGRFAAWIFDHFEAVAGPDEVERLLELWDAWPCPDENWVRRNLALAIARNHPDRREQVLLAVLEERPTPWMAEVLSELLEDGLGDHLQSIEPWFFAPDSMSADENRAAMVEALSKGPNGKADIGRLVTDERFATDSPVVIQALIEAARELGREIECGESIVAQGSGEVLEKAKHTPREITPEDERRARDARAACLKRIESWLRGR